MAISLCRSRRQRKPAFHRRIVRRQQNPAIGFDGEHRVADRKVQAVSHILRERGSDGAADLAELDFADHACNVARVCYITSGQPNIADGNVVEAPQALAALVHGAMSLIPRSRTPSFYADLSSG